MGPLASISLSGSGFNIGVVFAALIGAIAKNPSLMKQFTTAEVCFTIIGLIFFMFFGSLFLLFTLLFFTVSFVFFLRDLSNKSWVRSVLSELAAFDREIAALTDVPLQPAKAGYSLNLLALLYA